MKFITTVLMTLFLLGCATDDATDGLMPQGSTPIGAPWGYTDMCDDPERNSEIHCPPEEETE